MHTMSMLCSTADVVNSSSWPILFKVLTLSVAICTVRLHLSNFLHLSCVADFFNTGARTPTLAECTSCLPARRTYVLSDSHGNLLMAVFLSNQ